MRNYEAMVIVDPRLDEGDTQKAVERFLDAIRDSEGEVTGIDRWGVRKFAYEIDHQNEGYYFVTNFKASNEAVDRLKRLLLISDEFIRGKVIRPNRDRSNQGAKNGIG